MLSYPRDLRTELYLDGWTDVSDRVRQTSAVTITRGRNSGATAPQPAKCSLVLDDAAGDFAPRNPLGQWYGLLSRNTPIRLSLGVARDTFARTVAAGWGQTDTGDTWTHSGSGASSVAAGAGVLSGIGAGGAAAVTLDMDVADQDVCVLAVAGATTAVAGDVLIPASVQLRDDGVNCYLVRVTWPLVGTMTLSVYRISGGATLLGTVDTGVPGSVWGGAGAAGLRLRAHVEGGTVRARVWAASSLEPFDWQVTATDPAPLPAAALSVRSDRGAANTNAVDFTYRDVDVRSGRFHGELSDLSPAWMETHTARTVPVQAGGTLRRLAQRDQPEMSTLRRGLLFDTANRPVQYWPCEEGADATELASALPGLPPMLIFGTRQLASYSGMACTQPIPTMAADSAFVGDVPNYLSPGNEAQVRFLLAVPSSGAVDMTPLAIISTTGTLDWTLYYTAGGGIRLMGLNAASVAIVDSTIAFGLNGFNGRVSLELEQNGTGVDWRLGTYQIGASSAGFVAATATASSVGLVRSVYVAAGGMSIGQITVQPAVDTLFDLSDQLQAYAGESAGDRFLRLCSEADIEGQVHGDPADTTAMGPQRPDTIAKLLTECAAADLSELYEAVCSPALVLRPHRSMTSQAARLTLDYAAGDVAAPLSPVDDDQDLTNDVTAKQPAGSDYRATLDVGPLSTAPPPDGVGRYDSTATVNVYRPAQLADVAGWLLHQGTTDEARYPSIRAMLTTGVDELAALDVGIGDRIEVVNLDAALIYDPVRQLVRGYTEQYGTAFKHDLVWSCQPAEPWRVLVLDDPDFGRLDTDASTLAADVTTAAGTLSVATAAGGPLWTVAVGQFPLDITVGGERMTVTAITGATSPQTFTVTRAINGVTKAHAAGARVGLADPVYLGK